MLTRMVRSTTRSDDDNDEGHLLRLLIQPSGCEKRSRPYVEHSPPSIRPVMDGKISTYASPTIKVKDWNGCDDGINEKKIETLQVSNESNVQN